MKFGVSFKALFIVLLLYAYSNNFLYTFRNQLTQRKLIV